jgi:hypothetical protein
MRILEISTKSQLNWPIIGRAVKSAAQLVLEAHMSIESYFSQSFDEARAKFRATALASGATMRTYENPNSLGPLGETLSTDIAFLGPEDANAVYLTFSGTHGAEGYCGSGIQSAQFAEGLFRELPQGVRVIQVHAINPHGFAWGRRVNEDNVDLNRNFVDFQQRLPDSAPYEQLHDWMIPQDWDGPSRRAADQAIDDFVVTNGHSTFQSSLTGGQYTRPGGLFYGGQRPTWSRELVEQIIAENLTAHAKRVIVIDYHTGLGPSAHGLPITTVDPNSPSYTRCKEWFGPELTNPADGQSATSPVVGTMLTAFQSLRAEVAPLVMEFGTVPIETMLDSLRGDHWLHQRGSLDHPLAAQLKARMRAAFYTETAAWKVGVFGRAVDFTLRSLRALTN